MNNVQGGALQGGHWCLSIYSLIGHCPLIIGHSKIMADRKLSILFSGMVAGDPGQGGATWAVLQYVLGLRRLGHEVCLVEPVQREKLRPGGTALGDSTSAAYFGAVAGEFGLGTSSALLLAGTQETVGLPYD